MKKGKLIQQYELFIKSGLFAVVKYHITVKLSIYSTRGRSIILTS